MTAQDVIARLGLVPHPIEGGFFLETYKSNLLLEDGVAQGYAASTAIYYLLTPETCSRLHRLRFDEVFHHYAGDAVAMLWLLPGGASQRHHLGRDFAGGERPQLVVPAGVWQGAWLATGGKHGWALLGCTVAPGFNYRDYEDGERQALLAQYPHEAAQIEALTPLR